jgi:hypothetical protein
VRSRLPIIGAIALLVALGGYFWSSSRPAKKVVHTPEAGELAPPPGAETTPGAPRRAAPVVTPPAMSPAPDAGAPARPDEGTEVVDKRGEGPTRRTPIAKPTVDLLLSAGEPLVKKCGEPLAARGQKTRLSATVSLKAENGQLSVTKTVVSVELLDDPELVACIEKALGGLRLPAPPEQSDMEYRLTLPYAVP